MTCVKIIFIGNNSIVVWFVCLDNLKPKYYVKLIFENDSYSLRYSQQVTLLSLYIEKIV